MSVLVLVLNGIGYGKGTRLCKCGRTFTPIIDSKRCERCRDA